MTSYPVKFRTYIENLITYCRNEAWHGIYRYGVSWSLTPLGNNNVATIEIDHVYLNFCIEIGPIVYDRWKKKEFKQIGGTILHEICHLFGYPMKDLIWSNTGTSLEQQIKEIDERQTQILSVVLNGLLPNEWYLPENVAAYMADLEKKK